MDVDALTTELSQTLALSGPELVYKGLVALTQKEINLAELEIATLRERYDVLSKEALYQAIETQEVVAHPAWEDYIVWKNKEAHIEHLRRLIEM